MFVPSHLFDCLDMHSWLSLQIGRASTLPVSSPKSISTSRKLIPPAIAHHSVSPQPLLAPIGYSNILSALWTLVVALAPFIRLRICQQMLRLCMIWQMLRDWDLVWDISCYRLRITLRQEGELHWLGWMLRIRWRTHLESVGFWVRIRMVHCTVRWLWVGDDVGSLKSLEG
jgi:hypothetical protein